MIDFHAHLLPGMDDGSKNILESTKMLEAALAQGVNTIVATPHFYPWQEKPQDFLERRALALEALEGKAEKIRPGAEVAYYDGIDYSKDIEQLNILGTELILIEMPMTIWSRRMIDTLHNLEHRTGLRVVLAHLDRYLKLQKSTEQIGYLCEHFLIQINADYFINRGTQRKALKLLKAGMIDFIGSDCHNLTTRPPNLGEAYQTIEKKCGLISVNAFNDKQKKYLKT